jgi:hypothetical protein
MKHGTTLWLPMQGLKVPTGGLLSRVFILGYGSLNSTELKLTVKIDGS